MRRLPAPLLLLLLGTACPGRLEDPERFESAAAEPCTLDVERTLLPASCGSGGCHGTSNPAAGLDLVSPGVAQRLLDVKSSCRDKPLVNASGSYLLEKLHPRPGCGTQMPLGTPLTASELGCVEQYVRGLQEGGAQ